MNRLTWFCRTLSLAGKETQERVEAGLREQGVEAILAWSPISMEVIVFRLQRGQTPKIPEALSRTTEVRKEVIPATHSN